MFCLPKYRPVECICILLARAESQGLDRPVNWTGVDIEYISDVAAECICILWARAESQGLDRPVHWTAVDIEYISDMAAKPICILLARAESFHFGAERRDLPAPRPEGHPELHDKDSHLLYLGIYRLYLIKIHQTQ